MEYKFKLLKIHCAGCALALEQIINEIDGVSAEINFVTKLLKLEINSDNPAETLTEVKAAISKFDHQIEISDYVRQEDFSEKEKREREKNIIRLSVAAVILIVNFFMPVFWIKICIYVLTYLLVSYKVLYKAARNILHGKVFDETFLMTLASLGAFIIGEYTEAVSVMLLYEVGEILEDVAVGKSKRMVESLLEIKQPYANFYDGESETRVLLSELSVGDLIIIKPGERVPLDSEIIEGTSYLDMSVLTGETKDVIVKPHDHILSGSINGSSVLIARVEKTESESTVSKIVELVERATESKAKTERFISKFSRIYTPVVIALAFIIAFIPPIFSGYTNFTSYAYRALCFLVVSCPCALVISVPLTYFASIGSFARMGIMVKGANFVEVLAKVNAVVFDKTGTLTKGEFEISEIYASGEHTKSEILETAAYAESFSNHKIAKSLVSKYLEENEGKAINQAWINDYTEYAGKGIKANIFMQETLIGNSKFLKENGIKFFEVNKTGTVLYVAAGGEYLGYIVIEDTIRPDSALAIKGLKEMKISDIMLCTGDSEAVAVETANKLGIKNPQFGLLPEDKVAIITNKVNSGKTVAFVGDGINDAPSLASSSVGISMGKLGSDIAIEASDVVLMTDEPKKVALGIKKARKTRSIVLQNIIGSISIKVIILGLIAFGISGMWLAVFADVGVNLLAVLNSLRAMLKQKEKL